MVPPRLTLVSDSQREDDAYETADGAVDAHEAAVLRALSDPEAAVEHLSQSALREKLRRLEAMLFASSGPLDAKTLQRCLNPDDDVNMLLGELQEQYRDRGISLVRVAGRWQFRTADDLSFLLERQQKEERKLSKAALETLAIIAYHQPVTRAEIEEIRGVSTSPGTLDVLMETSWIRPRGRRRAPGRPLTYGTTDGFLVHFGLDAIKDLPGLADLKAAGLLDANLPPGFTMPAPTDVAALMPDELPLTDDGDEEAQDELALDGEQDDGEDEDGVDRDVESSGEPESADEASSPSDVDATKDD